LLVAFVGGYVQAQFGADQAFLAGALAGVVGGAVGVSPLIGVGLFAGKPAPTRVTASPVGLPANGP